MKKLLLSLILCALVFSSFAQENLIPQPKSLKVTGSKFVKPAKTNVSFDSSLPCEGYTINIVKKAITITAADSAGLVWAGRTLEQLVRPDGSYPMVEISDYPDFKIRGFMHDTGRNFIEVDMLKEHIELLSRYKINAFHWHLTDYPSWRIECRVFPQLNDPQYQRKGRDEGRFYTYDEIRDVIAFARERGVMVIPEIDMPGHSASFTSAMGFSMASPEGMAALEKCLDEFFGEITVEMAPYFHLGSDEVHVSDPAGFMKWAEDLAAKYNRQPIAWDPGLPAASTTIRQIWNEASGANSGAAQKEGAFLDSFMGYLNYYNPILFANRLLLHTPCAVETPREESMGGILCLWNDVNVDDKNNTMPHNGAVASILPFSERFWNGGYFGDQSEIENINLLPAPSTTTGQMVMDFEKKMSYHRDNLLQDQNMRWVANSQLQWSVDLAGKSVDVYGGDIDMEELTKLHGVKVEAPMTVTATTKLYAPVDTVIRAWVAFDTQARSDKIGNGIGEQGEWEAEGQIFVNGEAVKPPVAWNEPGAYKHHFHTWAKPEEEFPFTDEQLYWMREPAYITLKKGENTIVVKSTKTFNDQRWTFTFIPMTLNEDGSLGDLSGVKYSSGACCSQR
ncbi:MAG: family 20 glycosylhydrolase [Rikenellaceae bacterium]